MNEEAREALEGAGTGTEPLLLSELIDAVKLDLIESAKDREPGFEPLFKVTEATVETKVTAQRRLDVEGKLGVYLVSVGTKGQQTNEATHTIQVRLTPVSMEGTPAEKDPTIRGTGRS